MRSKLIEFREMAGLTQEDIAKKVGISRSFYGHIEKGIRNPTYGLAKKIAEIFGVTAEELFFDIECFSMKQDPKPKAG